MKKEPLIYIDRRNTDCCKWDGEREQFGETELLPLWIADMDFLCPAAVRQAITEWASQGVFGYYQTPDRYFEAFRRWELEEHGFAVKREWMRFSPGIVSAIYWIVQMFTQPGDPVTVLTPVYYPFLHAVEDNGRKLVCCDLTCAEGRYTVDFAQLEQSFASTGSKLLIFSSPHNPVGRVWSREELEKLCRLCEKYGVIVLSDEIHQDLVLGEQPHIPTASLGIGKVITCISSSKTFNIAGLKNSCVLIPDPALREVYDRFAGGIHVMDGASVGYVAATAALESGKPWLESLKEQVRENYQAACAELMDCLPKAVIAPLEGTYLMWLDLRAYVQPEQIHTLVQEVCGLAVDYGEWFGGKQYQGMIRLNLATSLENIMLAVERLCAALTE